MDIATPSRFACLKIEEEDRPYSSKPKRRTDEKIAEKSKTTQSQSKKLNGNTQNGKKSASSGQKQNSQPTAKKSKSRKGQETKQWEEWKKRDDELVDNNFEQQLQSAILQSKLEFEKQKKSAKTEPDSQGKKKKAKTMSLDQFLEGDKENEKKESQLRTENGRDFFKEVMQSAKQEIKREKVEEERKKRTEKFEEIVSLAQCQEKLEEERAKNASLQKELEEAREEIALVKKRNSTLCSMLSQGEMKDKAAVLLELERLTSVKEELTEEVSRLHKLLEQERSGKVHNSPDKVEKNDRSDSSSKHSKDKPKRKKN